MKEPCISIDPQNGPKFSGQAVSEASGSETVEARRLRKHIQIDPLGFLGELGVTPKAKPPETAD